MKNKNEVKNKLNTSEGYLLSNSIKGVTGKVYFDYVVLTIHEDRTQYQGNNICWLEENIIKNLDSAQDMPLLAQFMNEEKDIPVGHGYAVEKNGKVVMYDSEQVGSVVKAEIRDVEVDGKTIKSLVATGYINEIRYPALCQWLKAQMYDKKPISTSVEIFAKKGNDFINSEYEEIDDVEICIPVDFDFGGSAILTVQPADSNAIVLEILNSRKDIDNKKEEEDMKLEEIQNELAEAKKTIEEKVATINSLEEEVATLNEEKETLTEKVTTLEETTEANKTLEEEKASLEEQVTVLTEEKESLAEFKSNIEKENLIAKLNEEVSEFDEDLVEEVKEEIEDFKQEPTQEKSDSIINSLNASFVKKAKAQSKKEVDEEKKEEFKVNSLFVGIQEEENDDDSKEKQDIDIFEK